MTIPSVRPRPWHTKEAWPARIAAFLALVAGTGALIIERRKASPDALQTALLSIALLGAFALGVLKTSQARYKDAREEKKESPKDLSGPLHVLHRVVAHAKGVRAPPDGWLRITLHRVDGEFLEQSVDYVGSADKARGAGRRFSIREGLIGRVARMGAPRRFDRPRDMSDAEWVDYLVEQLGMTHDSARKTREQRYSFLGVPIKNANGDVDGVVYLDAADPEFFDKAVLDLVITGCEGLATWIGKHYPT